jgi:hypothetical protein
MSSIVSTANNLRSNLAHRRSIRRQQLKLEQELASYSSPSDRVELDAMLTRHTANEIAAVERILNHQAINAAKRRR